MGLTGLSVFSLVCVTEPCGQHEVWRRHRGSGRPGACEPDEACLGWRPIQEPSNPNTGGPFTGHYPRDGRGVSPLRGLRRPGVRASTLSLRVMIRQLIDGTVSSSDARRLKSQLRPPSILIIFLFHPSRALLAGTV